MAKILSVELQKIPKYINVGDDVNDITVLTKIQFHDFDLKLEMPYCLHIFVYDIHGDVDAPLVLPNWDESILIPVSLDRKDDFLGKEVIMVNASESELIVNTPMSLKLGQFNRQMSLTSRKLEVFATIAPVIARASKYSEPFTTNLSY
ncbi:hypothetical protein LCGC14_0129080 [marine sediment metagenome]|uniref:Uncharacterized protein n=1 Tax=marine sediment metagenome TaxID=412755 RepID=A0A0F9XLD3_9ZZZZ|nr:hypothetical protein [Maribacter sp.]HDZ06122.1 hypothetical protein [Maribacter sp.]HEA80834.1 hypothetical protein [Maribacter sp.]